MSLTFKFYASACRSLEEWFLGLMGHLTGLKCLDWKVKHSVIPFVLLTAHNPNSILFRFGHWWDCCTRNDDHWWKTGHVRGSKTHLPNSKVKGRFYHPDFLFLKADSESSQTPNPGLSNFKSSHSSKHLALCSLLQVLEQWVQKVSQVSLVSIEDSGSRRWRGDKEQNYRSSDSALGQWACPRSLLRYNTSVFSSHFPNLWV